MTAIATDAKVEQKTFLFEFIKKTFGTGKPLAKLLKTQSGGYLYDTGTNKIVIYGEDVYRLLFDLMENGSDNADNSIDDFISQHGENQFFAAAGEIAGAMQSENVLLVKNTKQFGLSAHFKDYRKLLNSSIKSMSLDIIDDCNLRCSYCTYHQRYKGNRNYSGKSMSREVAQKAIRFLKEHSYKNNSVSLGFYGGEPLMRFPFIKECVEYAKKIFDGRKLMFNMTTNATLITPDIAEYLLKEGFSLLVSLDGPELFHDSHRKDKNGKGSYNNVIEGFKHLAEKYNEINKGKIAVNAVYTPPFSEKKINRINEFFKELHWLPGVTVMVEYPVDDSVPWKEGLETDLSEDKDLMQWALEKYKTGFGKTDVMARGVVEKKLAEIVQRPVLTRPSGRYTLNGCCVPGHRKCFVSSDGDIRVCEKISSSSPTIGNVDTGFDFEVIQRVYIDEYSGKSIRDCSRCWGARLCDICYIQAFDEHGKIDLKKKAAYCELMLESLEKALVNFVSIMEENPGEIEYLYRYEIT